MAYLIGTDEAGYGPNLGPLVIAASLWHLPGDPCDEELEHRLGNVVVRRPARGATRPQVPIADSKTLYKSKGNLGSLEGGLFPCLDVAGGKTSTWEEIWESLAPGSFTLLNQIPWYRDFQTAVPRDADPNALATSTMALRNVLRSTGISLLAIRARVVFAGSFNEQVSQLGSKGTLLSQHTLDLVRELTLFLGEESILIHCDKHGGRSRYQDLLQQYFLSEPIEILEESRPRSTYCFGPPQRRVEIRFVAKGDRFLPSGLASMAAKYLRELAMLAFNRYWSQHIPDLKPTAGYPVDAQRFLDQIEEMRQNLGIPLELLWRQR